MHDHKEQKISVALTLQKFDNGSSTLLDLSIGLSLYFSCIYSAQLNSNSLSTCSLPDTVLCTRDKKMNKYHP